MIIGIVGSEAAKFTPETEAKAKQLIENLLTRIVYDELFGPLVVDGYSSGHCHLGGIDIWTEEVGSKLGLPAFIYPPKTLQWATGYKPRNIQIVERSDEVHNITVKTLPPGFKGMKFDGCYHCNTHDHIKSGGCWTANYAQKLGKPAYWHVIE